MKVKEKKEAGQLLRRINHGEALTLNELQKVVRFQEGFLEALWEDFDNLHSVVGVQMMGNLVGMLANAKETLQKSEKKE